MNAEVLWSLRQNILDLWLSIALSVMWLVLQNLPNVDRSWFDLRAVCQIYRWKLDGTMIAVSNVVLQIRWQRHFEVGLPLLVFSISQCVSRATVVQNVTRHRVARTNFKRWLFESSVDRCVGVIPDRDAPVAEHFI